MKFGVVHYRTPGDTLEAFLDWAAETGFDCVELNHRDIAANDDDNLRKQAEHVQSLVQRRGLAVSALGAGNDFVVLDEQEIQRQVDRMVELCEVAKGLGTNVVRTEGGKAKPHVSPPDHGNAIAECLKRCRDAVERLDVYLAVDNHGTVTNDVELQLQVLNDVGSDHIGTNLDTANYRWAGYAIEQCNEIYDQIAPYALHTHFKDCTGSVKSYRSTVLGEGEVDLTHALNALDRAGYSGVYCAEWEGEGDSGTAYAKCLQWLKAHVKAE